MSGTSLDGLDICYSRFKYLELNGVNDPREFPDWSYEIIQSRTFEHPLELRQEVEKAHLLPKDERVLLSTKYAEWVIQCVEEFLHSKESQETIDVLGFHGPTLFHSVEDKFSYQLGDPQLIADRLQCDVVADFRTADLLKGGRGAPLVPSGDDLLFREFDARVNLGGFANYSLGTGDQLSASDSSICNYAMDRMAQTMGIAFDKDGNLARSGKIDENLLHFLNTQMSEFNSGVALTREWAEKKILYDLLKAETPNSLTTLSEHIAIQLAERIGQAKKVVVTGGGARNSYLIERISAHIQGEVVIPDEVTIDMKEALIFSLLALLKKRNLFNVFSGTTGVPESHITGELFLGRD